MNKLNKKDVNLLTRKDVAAEVKPVYAWGGFARYVGGYVTTGYGFTSDIFPRRGMAESFIKSHFRGDKK